MLINLFWCDRIKLRGAAENGKRFAFRQSEYILRTSGILGVIQVENKGKGTEDDVWNNSRYCRYCSDDDQYRRHGGQYHTKRKER